MDSTFAGGLVRKFRSNSGVGRRVGLGVGPGVPTDIGASVGVSVSSPKYGVTVGAHTFSGLANSPHPQTS